MNYKIIALLPVKNEQYYLPSYLKNVLPIVDKLIVIDDNSTDNGVNIIKNIAGEKASIHKNETEVKAGWAEFSIRQKLLELGREAGGEIFVILDADETFTTNFLPLARKVFNKLEVGQKLSLQWLACYKSSTHYIDDNSVWSNNFKDFAVRDDGKISHIDPKTTIGVGRTPGPNTDTNWLKLNNKYGAVLHYQFTNWNNFQLKQCWYRMNECLLQGKQNVENINQKYSITLENPMTRVRACPNEWLLGLPEIDINEQSASWHLEAIKQMIEIYGAEYFSGLNINHVPMIKELLIK